MNVDANSPKNLLYLSHAMPVRGLMYSPYSCHGAIIWEQEQGGVGEDKDSYSRRAFLRKVNLKLFRQESGSWLL